MASKGRRPDPALTELLFDRAYEFRFFQAVRLMERIRLDQKPGGVGTDAMPEQEPIRFRVHRSMEFPASQLRQIQEPATESDPVAMTVAFMGLTGPVGALPWHYTELLIELALYQNPGLEEFFSLFDHRMISLFYRAWEKHRFFISFEKHADISQLPGREHPEVSEPTGFTQYLFDLIGMGTVGLRNRLPFPDHALLRYAGLIAQRPHSLSALRGILSDYFSVPVVVEPFCGKWFSLGEGGLSRLGVDHSQLGVDVIAGEAVWNQQAQIRIQAGPMNLERFRHFLPDGNAFRALKHWVHFFIGQAIEFQLQLVLNADNVPECQPSGEALDGARLGWTSWLKTENFDEDARHAVFSAVEEVAQA
jgi:type VI secretion system protein ImpH